MTVAWPVRRLRQLRQFLQTGRQSDLLMSARHPTNASATTARACDAEVTEAMLFALAGEAAPSHCQLRGSAKSSACGSTATAS